MTIKDKLAHYEPKPLGEKGRYAVLLPLIYDVKKKLSLLYKFFIYKILTYLSKRDTLNV